MQPTSNGDDSSGNADENRLRPTSNKSDEMRVPDPRLFRKEYLGDGLYAQLDGAGQVRLTAENGVYATDTVYLEAPVVEQFLHFIRKRGFISGWSRE